LPTGEPAGSQDRYEQREHEQASRILGYLASHPHEFDLIHDHSGSFFCHAAQCPAPVLATLHLPRSFYREKWLRRPASNLSFNCVSQLQAHTFADLRSLPGVVQNGIAVERFRFTWPKRDYLLWMGRICEEKAPHLAIAAARLVSSKLIVAGQVYPFRYHQQFFEREIRPQLGRAVEFVNSPSFRDKVELLRNARALLLTSTAEETSSLVAMEAMACGTPVVAMRRGAFPEIVSHGETGFVVDGIAEMAAAVARLGEISPESCRMRVEELFSAGRMSADYEAFYRDLFSTGVGGIAA